MSADVTMRTVAGYHYTPKDYFHDNPDMKPKDWDDDTPLYNKVGTTKGKEEPKSVEPSFIPMVFVSKSLSAYKTKNPLYQYLCGVIGEDEVKRIFRLYLVGTGEQMGRMYRLLADRRQWQCEGRQTDGL